MSEPTRLQAELFAQLSDKAQRWAKKALLVVLAINLVLLFYYVFKGYMLDFHSDSAAKSLLAEEIRRTGDFFPADWNYVNGDLWVLFGHIFILPFLPWIENGFFLHAISGTFTGVLVLFSLWLVTGMLTKSVWLKVLVVAIFAGGISWVMAENLFGQGSYGSVLYMACFSLYFGWRYLLATSPKHMIMWSVALGVALMLAFWANPQRALAYSAAPLALSVMAWMSGQSWVEWRPGLRAWRATPGTVRLASLASVCVLAALLGIGLHAHFIEGVNNIAGAGAARWLGFDGVVRNVWLTLEGLVAMLGGTLPKDYPVFTAGGVYYALRFSAALVLIALIPVQGLALLRGQDRDARMYAAFVLSSFALFLFVQGTTTTPDMSDPVVSGRYLVPAMVLGIIMVVSRIQALDLTRWAPMLALFVAVMLVSSPVSSLNPMSRAYTPSSIDQRMGMIKELERRGLRYGYASYWNASALTVLSGQRVKIRPVEVHRKLPQPRRHLSSNHWYRDDAWKGPVFLLLTPEESRAMDWEAISSLAGPPLQQFQVAGLEVHTFATNFPATELPGWQTSDTDEISDLTIRMNLATAHTAGKLEQAGQSRRMVAQQGESGYLHFGPYLRVSPGTYRATFNIETGSQGEVGDADAAALQGSRIFAATKLKAGPNTIEFAIDKAVGDLELRVISNGSAKVALSTIEIHKLPPK